MKFEQHTIPSLVERLGLPRTTTLRKIEDGTLQVVERSCGGKVLKFKTEDIEKQRADYSSSLAQRLVQFSANPQVREDARLIDAWNNATTPEARGRLWPQFWRRFTASVDFQRTFRKADQIKANHIREFKKPSWGNVY